MKSKVLFWTFLFLAFSPPAFAAFKSGDMFNPIDDINWGELNIKFKGICICPAPPPVFVKTGLIWEYWEPFLLIDTVSVADYSPMTGAGDTSTGTTSDILGGKNKSSDATSIADESTFAQAHGFLLPLFPFICNRNDYGAWWSEFDATWQNDELTAIITPEAALFANKVSQMACMADAAAVNVGWPLDVMPWCMGSSGSTYPISGHVDNDNIVQANNAVASRMIFKLCRLMMICDPEPLCGCMVTPVWIKSHYKMHTARPAKRATYPIGKSAKFYDSGLNPPFMGAKGSNDEFLWVVFRLQRCCTCCE